MESSNSSYVSLVDQILHESDLPEDRKTAARESARAFEARFSLWTRAIFAVAILGFFAASYLFTYEFIQEILESETALITQKLLDAKDRSINGMTVTALIAATVTQTGLAFYAVTKYLFKSPPIAAVIDAKTTDRPTPPQAPPQ
jgi:hypothetical protein